jgi:hypothetical protein
MDLNADHAVKCFSGETRMRSELSAAFDRVAHAEDFKLPVSTALPALSKAEQALISDAVVFFTGSVPTFRKVGASTLVEAAGYYATVGA